MGIESQGKVLEPWVVKLRWAELLTWMADSGSWVVSDEGTSLGLPRAEVTEGGKAWLQMEKGTERNKKIFDIPGAVDVVDHQVNECRIMLGIHLEDVLTGMLVVSVFVGRIGRRVEQTDEVGDRRVV